jgi:hypothetical protein
MVKEDIGRRRRSLGRRGKVFQGSRSSRLLGLVFCLMIMMMNGVVFHLRIGSVSDDGFWKEKRRGEESQKINLEGGP